jgi:putative MATE family efflux protein
MIDRTTGSLTGHLVRTSGLAMVTLIFQALYLLVDLYWVGRLGTDAVAAVGVSSNLMFFVLGATQVLGIGTTTLVAHATGRRDPAEASFLMNQALGLSFAAGGLFLIVVLALRMPYVHALSADAEISALAATYLLWFVPAMALQFCLTALGSALRGTGVFRPGVVVQTVSVLANIVLAPVFMFGWLGAPRLGVVGAAAATLIAILLAVSGLVSYLWVTSDRQILRIRPADWRPRPHVWRRILSVGLPASAEFAMTTLYLMFVYAVSRPFGATAQAGFGIGQRILQAAVLPAVALGFAIGPIAGQNVGARDGARVRATVRVAVALSTGMMLVLALAIRLSGDVFLRIFSTDPAVRAAGREYLAIAVWGFVPLGLVFVSSAMFQALGNTIPALVTAAARLLVIALPTLWLSSRPGFSLASLWYLSVAALFVQVGLNAWLLVREVRKRLAPDVEPA